MFSVSKYVLCFRLVDAEWGGWNGFSNCNALNIIGRMVQRRTRSCVTVCPSSGLSYEYRYNCPAVCELFTCSILYLLSWNHHKTDQTPTLQGNDLEYGFFSGIVFKFIFFLPVYIENRTTNPSPPTGERFISNKQIQYKYVTY